MSTQRDRDRRIVFDLSTTTRWLGPAVGIVRVEREIAMWARRNVPGVVFGFFSPYDLRYHHVQGLALDMFLSGGASIDTLGFSDPSRQKKRKTDRIPTRLQPLAMWVLQFRHKLLQTLERIRLRTHNQTTAQIIDKLQRWMMSPKYQAMMLNKDGTRRPFVPWDLAFGDEIEFRPSDILVCVGSNWVHTDIRAIARRKADVGFRFAVMCHDVIPLKFPHFCQPQDVEVFGSYYEIAFAIADLVICNSHKVVADVRDYCTQHGIAQGPTVVTPFGANPSPLSADALPELPANLRNGGYALFVSTIEPRKGHRLLYEVWLRLLREGIPQATDFKLVFVGRPGWVVDDLMRLLTQDPRVTGSLHVLPTVSDNMLTALYRGAAFCVYPSVYEGYGLPIVEAFFNGKAVLASTGGALLEVVGEFSPCLDPLDPEVWYRMFKLWIEDPSARAPYEEIIRTRYRHSTWEQAAAAFFALIDSSLPATTKS